MVYRPDSLLFEMSAGARMAIPMFQTNMTASIDNVEAVMAIFFMVAW